MVILVCFLAAEFLTQSPQRLIRELVTFATAIILYAGVQVLSGQLTLK